MTVCLLHPNTDNVWYNIYVCNIEMKLSDNTLKLVVCNGCKDKELLPHNHSVVLLTHPAEVAHRLRHDYKGE